MVLPMTAPLRFQHLDRLYDLRSLRGASPESREPVLSDEGPAGHGHYPGALVLGMPGAGVDRRTILTLLDRDAWLRLDSDTAAELEELRRSVAQERSSGRPGCAALASALLAQFVIRAARALCDANPLRIPPAGAVWSIEEARAYIDANYDRAHSLDFFLDKCAASAGEFSRRFKAAAGCPLFEYINRKRVERACFYIKASGMSITHIAAEVGYNNLSFFNRYFQRIMGMSPGAYRSLNRREK